MTPRLVVVGVSLGALKALYPLLAAVKTHFPAALVIVLHREKNKAGELPMLLKSACTLPVLMPVDKQRILTGQVYLAPPDYHLLVEDDHFALSMDEPENFSRPSIDVLFESAAEACGASLTGVILTGTGCDGARGLAAIHRHGGCAIVQAEAYAPQMPQAALNAVPEAKQMTLPEIAAWLGQYE